MKDSIVLQDKIYISAKRAAKLMNYAQDYIGQLCRSGKLDSTMVGRSWFVTEASLLSHRENAIDGTQDRSDRIVRTSKIETNVSVVDQKEVALAAPVLEVSEILTKIVETKITLPRSEPVLSSIQTLAYETEQKPFLPELKKAVPSPFALPKNSKNVLSVPSIFFNSKNERKVALRVVPTQKKNFAATVSAPRSILALPSGSVATAAPALSLQMIPHASRYTTLAITLVALGGFFFTLSIATFQNTRSVSYNQASVSSAASELVSEILMSIGLRGRTPSTIASRPAQAPAAHVDTTLRPGDMNGIGIFPAVNPAEDEAAKARIINSFSDEVVVSPDQSGTAGVITPVFKKTDGNDFVYVLVPVSEKKQ